MYQRACIGKGSRIKVVANLGRSPSFVGKPPPPQSEVARHRDAIYATSMHSFHFAKEMIMAFSYTNSKGSTYILHSQVTTLKNGNSQTIYFFGKMQKEGALDAVPDGYEVSESKNGLPVLKRSNKAE